MFELNFKKRYNKVVKPKGLMETLNEVYFGGLVRLAKASGYYINKPKDFLFAALFFYYGDKTYDLFPIKGVIDKLTQDDVVRVIERGMFYINNFKALDIDYTKYYQGRYNRNLKIKETRNELIQKREKEGRQ